MLRRLIGSFACWVAAVAAAPAARAVELHLQFGALERMLAEQVFTQEGRHYVRGDKSNKCNFAYLEAPKIQGDGGMLRIRAKFSGRSSLNALGVCVGLGDAFEVVLNARPQYRDGNIRLVGVKATSGGKTGFYIRRVCQALESSLARDFKYSLETEARRTLEAAGAQPGFQHEVKSFNVPEIRVTNEAVVLTVDFVLVVK